MSDIHDKHPSEDLLQAFLDGDVPSRERRRIEEHVASCDPCAQELATWRLLFDDLDALASHRPSADFDVRVMAGVHVPRELPWAARMKARLAELLPGRRAGHLASGLLQDLADGVLTGRRAARAEAHLEGCTVCAAELRSWATVMGRLSELDRYEPPESFADDVMAGLEAARSRQKASAPLAVPDRRWTRVLAGAKRFLPRTRRAWAAISGAAVTPAVTIALVLWTVFSHPTVTPQALTSFAFWQLTDLAIAAWSGLVAGGLAVARLAGLDGLVGAIVDAPLLVASGVALYAIAITLAVRILYKNLVGGRSPRHRYASASAS